MITLAKVKEAYRNFTNNGAKVVRDYDDSRITFYDDREGIIFFLRGKQAALLIRDATQLSMELRTSFSACAVYLAAKQEY